MALEPSITPKAVPTTTYWLDQIDVAVELPMGPAGEQGPPGTAWLVGPSTTPPTTGIYDEGTLYLGGDGKIYQYENGAWVDTGVDLIPPASASQPHDHNEFLRLAGGTMTGPLTGVDSTFTGNVVVPTPNAGPEAVNLDYLSNTLANLNLSKFLGDASGNAILTGGGGWNAGQGQAIYQHTGPSVTLPPGVTGTTTGLTMRSSSGNITQLICDLARNLWFVRAQVAGTWGQWSTLSPIISTSAPVDPPNGPPVPNGTIWIQTDSTVTP